MVEPRLSLVCFLSFKGERFDFVLNANAAPGNYWIKFEGHSRCAIDGHAYAILHYGGTTMETPTGNMTDFSQTDVVGDCLMFLFKLRL